jgi:hypothetical protein
VWSQLFPVAFVKYGLACCVAVISPRGILMCCELWRIPDALCSETNKSKGTCVISRLCCFYLETRDSHDFGDGGSKALGWEGRGDVSDPVRSTMLGHHKSIGNIEDLPCVRRAHDFRPPDLTVPQSPAFTVVQSKSTHLLLLLVLIIFSCCRGCSTFSLYSSRCLPWFHRF